MTSIYDDLANSDYVNPGQFKEQLKMMSNVKDSLDSQELQEQNHLNYQEDPNQLLKQKLKSVLPGQMYEKDSYQNNEDYLYFQNHLQNNTQQANQQNCNFGNDNNYGGDSLEQLKMQNIIQDLNPMDNENEQSLLRNQNAKYQQQNQKGAQFNDQNILIQAQNEFIKQKNVEQIIKQASEDKKQFEMKTQMRQNINEEDLLDNYQTWTNDQKTYDQLVEQRNRMIFEDNLDPNDPHEYMQQNQDSQNYNAMQNEQKLMLLKNKNYDSKAKEGDCHFTLNKYDSKSDLIKKVPVNHEEYDSQVQTAHFKKQAYGVPSQASDRARVNTEQTQRTNAANSRQDQRQKQNLHDHLIDQQVLQEEFDQQNYQNRDGQNVRNFDDGDYDYPQQQVSKDKLNQFQNEQTGQFGKKQSLQVQPRTANENNRKDKDQNIYIDYNSQSQINRSPVIINKIDQDNEKINQLLAQLQAPINIENILTNQSKDENYPMTQYDLEKAHQQMQQSIKQLKLVNKMSKNGMYGDDDQEGSINNHMGGGGPKNFNGQNSLYELANKVGHPLSSSNLNSDNDAEFQKILQGDGSLGSGNNPYSMHKFGGISGNNINGNQNEIINLANSENEQKFKPASNRVNDRNNYLQNNELFYNNYPNPSVNQDNVKNKQDTLAQINQRLFSDKNEIQNNISQVRGGVFRDAGELMLKEKRQSSKNSNQITVVFDGQNNDKNTMGIRSQSFNMQQQQPPQVQRINSNQNMANDQFQSQYNQEKKQMSLAQRANQAKLQNLNKQIQEQQSQFNYDNQYQMNAPYNKIDPYYNSNFQNQNPNYNKNFRQQFDPSLLIPTNENLNNFQQDNVYSTYNFQYQNSIQQPQKQPVKQQQKDFSSTIQNEKMMKRKALLMNIDDIPIHELHKADGYQIRQIDEDDISRANQDSNYLLNNVGSTSRSPNRNSALVNDGVSSKLDDELKNLSLSDKVFHKNWKVRLNAIREINQIMLDFVKNGGLQKVLQKEEQIYGDSSNPFDVYGPIIDKMIKDSNLTAQYEGLLCLQTYVNNGDDIKTVTSSCISFLLDKIQINKPNFKETTFNIIQMMIKRRQMVLPELLKRYKSVNPRVISFCLENLNKSFEDKNIFLQEANLKMIYKYTTDLLAHNVKELRDQSLTLITHVYENCTDDVQTFCSNIKGLRPIQIKELKETLQNHSKNLNTEYMVKLFDSNNIFEDKKETASPERSKSREKLIRNQFQNDQKDEKFEKQEEIDLCSILPENFSEIPRLNQIKQKQKAMEQFNQELEKLKQRQQLLINQENSDNINQESNNYFIKQKDYSNIFNIISSLLEDPNMLVFIESIKTVEHLSALLKQNFKREKAKQFIQLLADKYKESKTAVLTALEKSFDVIFDNKCMPPNLFFDILVNQISFSHKNPRVKQMVLERVEIIIEKYYLNNENQNDDNLQKNTSQIIHVLKQIKEKLQQIILKDTNASVRDQGVILVSLIKAIILKGGQNGNSGVIIIQEMIDALPKQRQSEIQKRIENYENKYPNRMNDLPQSRENEKQPKSRGVSAKSGAHSNRNPEKQNQEEEHKKVSPMKSVGQGADQQILFNTKKAQSNVSSKYQASLSDVIMTIKNISQDRDRLRIAQITENFEMALDELADGGIKECKSQIITCIFWLLSTFPQKINFLENDRQEAIKAVINFMKKLYCIDRQITISPSNGQGIPQELYQAVSSVLICFALFENDQLYNKQLSQILNLIFVASTESGLSPSYFINTLKQTFTKYDPCQKQLPKGKLIIISSTIYFISDRLGDIIEKSIKMQAAQEGQEDLNNRMIELKDFEEFRSIVIQQIEENHKKQIQDEDKQLLIQSLVYLKEQMNQYMLKQQKNNFKEQVQEPSIITFSGPRHLDVIQELKTNFEMGLQKLKELVKDEVQGKAQPLSYDQKELVVKELLHLTTQGYSNPQEQYKQAYSLKALMWLKDELIGNEDTFKLTSAVMNLYAKASFEGKDSSIEQYLLNFWTKDLSLRDIVDRIQYTVKYELVEPDSAFCTLFQWLVDSKLSNNESSQDQTQNKPIQNWLLEDFRKISLYIAQFMVQKNAKAPYQQSLMNSYDEENIVHQRQTMILNFLDMCVDKFTAKKVRDFMEIQLIHENNLLIKFIDQFDHIYRNLMPQASNKNIKNEIYRDEFMKISKDNLDEQNYSQSNMENRNKYNAGNASLEEGLDSLGEPLLTNRSNMDEQQSLMNSSINQLANRSQLLQEKRDKRKEETLKNQKEVQNRKKQDYDEFEDTLEEEKRKYSQIMEKLENFKSKKFQSSGNLEDQRQKNQNDSNENVNLKNIKSQKFEIENNPKSYDNNRFEQKSYNQNESGYLKPQSKGRGMDIDQLQRPGSERYKFQKNSIQDGANSLQEFNDDEDFRLSTDNQQSLAMLGMVGNSQKSSLVNNHYVQQKRNNLGEGLKQKKSQEDIDGTLESSHNYMNAFDSGISGRHTIINDGKSNDNEQFTKRFDKNISKEEQYLQESRQKIKQSVQYQEEKLQRLESSQIKVRQIKNEVDTLNDERRRLEEEKRTLLSEQNRETEEWKRRYNEMTRKNDEIISNLAEANRCYLRQCDENEKLSKQIIELQQQHKDFIQKYKQLEEKLQVSEKQVEIQQLKLLEESQRNMDSPRSSIHGNKNVIEEKLLNLVEQVFDKNQLVQAGQNQNNIIGIKRIQELLLDSDGQNQNLSKSLIFHYQKLKSKQDRMLMLNSLKQSLENEDILFAVSNEVYKSLLNFLLKSFSFEKELIERESLHRQHERELQNELTQESQRLVSKLLNSKEFTQSLICMIQLLKNEAMPEDFSANLSIQERQYLRVIMRCITRITKALHSENPELIRAFDVLIEMQRLFVKHPPENLRQDLPCLQDLDFVFRGLKDVSDKLIALQPQKCISFLEFCKQGKIQGNDDAAQSVESETDVSSGNYFQTNAFIKYIDQMIQTKVYSSNL